MSYRIRNGAGWLVWATPWASCWLADPRQARVYPTLLAARKEIERCHLRTAEVEFPCAGPDEDATS